MLQNLRNENEIVLLNFCGLEEGNSLTLQLLLQIRQKFRIEYLHKEREKKDSMLR